MSAQALVTGAAGFLARHVTVALRAAGTTVVGADVREIPAGRVDAALAADLFDPQACRQLVGDVQPGEVYHLVGQTKGDDTAVTRSNVETTQHLLDAVSACAPRATVVLVGSAAEYGRVPLAQQPVPESLATQPVSCYGRAKTGVTALGIDAAGRGLRVMVVRPFNVVGAGSPDWLVTGALVARMRAALAPDGTREAHVGATTAIRDFIDARDVAQGMLTAARSGRAGTTYNICTGQGRPVSDVVAILAALAGGAVRVTSDPSLFVAGEVDAMVGSPDRLNSLGWAPRHTLEDALADAWYAAGDAARTETVTR